MNKESAINFKREPTLPDVLTKQPLEFGNVEQIEALQLFEKEKEEFNNHLNSKKLFKVTIECRKTEEFEVIAENREEAKEIAQNFCPDGDFDDIDMDIRQCK